MANRSGTINTLQATFDARFKASGLVAAGFGIQTGDAPAQVFVGGSTALGSGISVPPDAPWHIGSITKTFTAVLVAMAAERDQLTLDTSLHDLLSADAHETWQSLTLREILSHTAGLPANPTPAEMHAVSSGQLQLPELLENYWTRPLVGKRGRFAYSNFGYILAAFILEHVTGQPWEVQLRERITGPLGMASCGIGPPDLLQGHRRTWLRSKYPVLPADPVSDNPVFFTPAGRLHISIHDMLIWGRFLLSASKGASPLLRAETASEMLHPVAKGYGLGLMHFAVPGVTRNAWGHAGSNTFWYALLAVMPEQDSVAFVAATEARPWKVDRLGVSLARAALAV